MPLWARVVVGMAFLGLSAPGWADSSPSATLGSTIPMPGSTYEDARAMSLDGGQRVVCDTDADKPRLDQPNYMDPSGNRGPARVRRCAIFAPRGDGVWTLGSVPSLAGPARLWLVFVEQGIGGRFRLAQISLWAKRDGWERVSALLDQRLGQRHMEGDRLLVWQRDTTETTMFMDEKYPDEFAVSVADVRLRRLIKSPGNLRANTD